jgi:hypothetical protein
MKIYLIIVYQVREGETHTTSSPAHQQDPILLLLPVPNRGGESYGNLHDNGRAGWGIVDPHYPVPPAHQQDPCTPASVFSLSPTIVVRGMKST